MRKELLQIFVTAIFGSVLITGSAFAGTMGQSGEHVKKMFYNALMFKFHNSGTSYFKDADKSLAPIILTSSSLTYDTTNPTDCSGCGDSSYGIDQDFNSTENAPIPEPATMVLLGTGLIGLVGLARKKINMK